MLQKKIKKNTRDNSTSNHNNTMKIDTWGNLINYNTTLVNKL